MRMSFHVDCVRNHLVEHGFVYTMRKKEVSYGPIKDTQWGKGGVVEVSGIGKCFVQLVSPTAVDNPSILERYGYVPHSGFETIGEWWEKVKAFKAVGGYLWLVKRID